MFLRYKGLWRDIDEQSIRLLLETAHIVSPVKSARYARHNTTKLNQSGRKYYDFFKDLLVDKDSARQLPYFFDKCQEIGLETGRGTSSRMLHWFSDEFGKINFGSIFHDGTVNTNYICSSAEAAGDLSIGEKYLSHLAELLGGYEVKKEGKSWNWRVCKGKKYPTIRECLAVQEQWLALIENTMQAFIKLRD